MNVNVAYTLTPSDIRALTGWLRVLSRLLVLVVVIVLVCFGVDPQDIPARLGSGW